MADEIFEKPSKSGQILYRGGFWVADYESLFENFGIQDGGQKFHISTN